jgi:hypothetical protein
MTGTVTPTGDCEDAEVLDVEASGVETLALGLVAGEKLPIGAASCERCALNWSGRGNKPAWVDKALERGKSLKDLQT